MQSKVIIQGLRLYAYHGVMPQERKIGANFIIDLDVDTDFSAAIENDNLQGTVSYADLFQLVKREMAIPSQLVEHVAGRIVKAILDEYPTITAVHIRILKENPPMGADCQGAGVDLKQQRNEQKI